MLREMSSFIRYGCRYVLSLWNKTCATFICSASYIPGTVNRTQSNCISIEFNQTKSNSIHELSSIEFGNRTKSNSHKNNWTIELNRTFDLWTLDFFTKLVLKINKTFLKARVTSVQLVFSRPLKEKYKFSPKLSFSP